ncbi:hypothetical protein [Streptomyces sp. SID3343]|nr:hypothetical protein [Streptomyces sp. SID3343]
MTKSGNNARKQTARQLAEAQGVSYTEAVRQVPGPFGRTSRSPRA